jgi:two-component system sensor histidine kinase AlgZ
VLQVNLFRVRDEVHIDIRNPLPKAGDDRARRIGNGMALENVRERLLLHFDAAATLTAKTVSGHYQVHIVLPYQEIVDAETITPVSGG